MALSLEHLQLLTNAKLTPDQLAAVMQVISPLLEMIEKRRAAKKVRQDRWRERRRTRDTVETSPETSHETSRVNGNSNLSSLTSSEPSEKIEKRASPPLVPPLKTETEAVDLWNAFAKRHGLVTVKVLSDTRKRLLGIRLDELGGLDGWRDALTIIAKSPHLLGENGRGWRATFDWVIQASNMLKTVEGNYVKEKNHTAARGLGNGRR